ncbi:DUF4190 domain-containing protein [bacterium]|nr:DUF4190 domain-containing protein [bacterium]
MSEGNFQTPPSALAGLTLGILGILVLGPLGSIPAIMLGRRALRQIKREALPTGKGVAIWGIVLGYVGIVFFLIAMAIVVLLLFWMRDASQSLMEGLF